MDQDETVTVLTEMRDEALRAVARMDEKLKDRYTTSAEFWRKVFMRRAAALESAIFICRGG